MCSASCRHVLLVYRFCVNVFHLYIDSLIVVRFVWFSTTVFLTPNLKSGTTSLLTFPLNSRE